MLLKITMVERIICILIGYCCGLVQTGYLYGKIKGMDIRSVGSGNAGTTNMLRTFGVKAGVITLLCDALKTIVAIQIAVLLFGSRNPELVPLLKVYAAAGAILGHDFPFFMHFKGGKGIAATAGLVIGFFDPLLFILGFVTFFGIFFTTHYVSLGSLMVWVGLFIEFVVMGQTGWREFSVMDQPHLIEMYIIMFLLGALAFWQHRTNIQRLLAGKERHTYLNHDKNQEEAERFKKLNS